MDECFKVNCDACGLATWQGCGRHIDSWYDFLIIINLAPATLSLAFARSLVLSFVSLANVPMADRCKCKACCQKDFDAAN
jgi:hypothetical protein